MLPPTSGPAPSGAPGRHTSGFHGPSLLIGVLGGIALGLGAVLLLGRGDGSEEGDLPNVRSAAAPPAKTAEGSRVPAREETRRDDTAAARTEASPEEEKSFTLEELRQLLSSSSRLDQIRAIELLLRMGTSEANEALLAALVTATDPVLLALLEEGLLRSPLDISPAVMAAFGASTDAKVLGRLAGLLTALAKRTPSLERQVVDFFVGALKAARLDTERAGAISQALVALGIGALEPLAAYVSDPKSDPEGAGTAAWVLAQLGPEHSEALRQKLGEGFESILQALRDPALSEADKTAVLQKTGSLAWAASLRPAAEHDRLGDLLVDNLTRTHSQEEAGTLGWGLANLKGLSDEARLRITQSLLDSVAAQADPTLAQSYAWTVSQLYTADPGRPLDANFYQALSAVQDAVQRYGADAGASPRLRWLLTQLRAYEQKKGG